MQIICIWLEYFKPYNYIKKTLKQLHKNIK